MDIWKHGTYVDTWSIVHFLSGFLLAGISLKLGLGIVTALLISTVLLVSWEAFEWLLKIIEPSMNVMMDIIIGIAGFFTGAYLMMNYQGFEWVFYVALVATVGLSLWGFFDFRKRGYR